MKTKTKTTTILGWLTAGLVLLSSPFAQAQVSVDICSATDTIETFFWMLFKKPTKDLDAATIASLNDAVIRAYDTLAGMDCDACQRRITSVEVVSPEDLATAANGVPLRRDLLQVMGNDNSKEQERKLQGAVASVNGQDYTAVFRVTIEQTGTCTTAFDTSEKIDYVTSAKDYVDNFCGSYEQPSSSGDGCCCVTGTTPRGLSADEFIKILEDILDVDIDNLIEVDFGLEDEGSVCTDSPNLTTVEIVVNVVLDNPLDPSEYEEFLASLIAAYNELVLSNCYPAQIVRAELVDIIQSGVLTTTMAARRNHRKLRTSYAVSYTLSCYSCPSSDDFSLYLRRRRLEERFGNIVSIASAAAGNLESDDHDSTVLTGGAYMKSPSSKLVRGGASSLEEDEKGEENPSVLASGGAFYEEEEMKSSKLVRGGASSLGEDEEEEESPNVRASGGAFSEEEESLELAHGRAHSKMESSKLVRVGAEENPNVRASGGAFFEEGELVEVAHGGAHSKMQSYKLVRGGASSPEGEDAEDHTNKVMSGGSFYEDEGEVLHGGASSPEDDSEDSSAVGSGGAFTEAEEESANQPSEDIVHGGASSPIEPMAKGGAYFSPEEDKETASLISGGAHWSADDEEEASENIKGGAYSKAQSTSNTVLNMASLKKAGYASSRKPLAVVDVRVSRHLQQGGTFTAENCLCEAQTKAERTYAQPEEASYVERVNAKRTAAGRSPVNRIDEVQTFEVEDAVEVEKTISVQAILKASGAKPYQSLMKACNEQEFLAETFANTYNDLAFELCDPNFRRIGISSFACEEEKSCGPGTGQIRATFTLDVTALKEVYDDNFLFGSSEPHKEHHYDYSKGSKSMMKKKSKSKSDIFVAPPNDKPTGLTLTGTCSIDAVGFQEPSQAMFEDFFAQQISVLAGIEKIDLLYEPQCTCDAYAKKDYELNGVTFFAPSKGKGCSKSRRGRELASSATATAASTTTSGVRGNKLERRRLMSSMSSKSSKKYYDDTCGLYPCPTKGKGSSSSSSKKMSSSSSSSKGMRN